VAAGAATVAFVAVQARGDHPMMPLELFRSKGFRIASSVGFAFMVGNYGSVFTTSLFLQQYLGVSPLHAGLVYLPSALFAITCNLSSVLITNRFGPRVPILAGQLLMVIGLVALFATVHLKSVLLVARCVIPIGAGGSLAMPAVTGVVLDGVDRHQAGTASAVFNTFRQVGGAVAIAVFGSLIAGSTTFLPGMRASLAIAAALLLGTALISLQVRSRTAPS
jgi:DHA2 family methylenomycin A resistance protein-like MFS transporter